MYVRAGYPDSFSGTVSRNPWSPLRNRVPIAATCDGTSTRCNLRMVANAATGPTPSVNRYSI